MFSVLKAVLAIALGLGFMWMEAKAAKPAVAFLGIAADSDPLIHEDLEKSILWNLGGDTTLTLMPAEEMEKLKSLGFLKGPELDPIEIPKLSALTKVQYYAFGRLEPIGTRSKRVWWAPWLVKVNWSKALRIRILDGATGALVYDNRVPAEFLEKDWWSGPDPRLNRMGPLERERYLRKLADLLSQVSAQAISKAIGDRANPSRTAAAVPPTPK